MAEVPSASSRCRGGLQHLDHSGVAADIARQPGVTGGRDVPRAYPVADAEAWLGVDGAQRTLGGRRVVGLVGFGDRWFFDVLAAQVAGAGVDRARREDGALGEHELGGVEPAPVGAVVQVRVPVQARDRVPERVHIPSGHPDGEQGQRERPPLPAFGEDRFVATRYPNPSPAVGTPMSAIPSMAPTPRETSRRSMTEQWCL